MKRLSIAAFISFVALIALLVPAKAEAANTGGRGEMTLGVMGGYATYHSGGFMNVYFQYTLAPHVRIAPDLGYAFRSEGKSAFLLDVDMHFPFRIARGIQVYPLAGFTFNSWDYKYDGSANRAGANIGGGFDFYLTSYLKLTLQAKYSIMNDTDGGFFGMGIGYTF